MSDDKKIQDIASQAGVVSKEVDKIESQAKVISKNSSGEEMVKIPKDKFEALLARVERIESAASKAGLSKYDSRHKGAKQKVINLLTINGKVVTSWDNMVRDIVEKNRDGNWREDQVINLHFEDGSEEKMDLIIFHRRYQRIDATVKKEIKNMEQEDIDKYEDVIFDCVTEDGRTYQIGAKFVN